MEKQSEEREKASDIFKTSKKAFLLGFKYEPKLMTTYFFIAIALTAFGLLQLTSFSKIIDGIVAMKADGGVVTDALIIQSVILGLSFLVPAFLQNFSSRFGQDLRLRYGTHLQVLKIDVFSKLDIGTIESTEFQTKLERAEQWGTGCIQNLNMLVFNVFKGVTGFLLAAIILYKINPWLVLLALIGSLPVYFIQKKYSYQLYSLYHGRTDESRIMSDRNSFFRTGKKVIEIILFNLGNRFKKEVREANVSFDDKILDVNKRRSTATFGSDFLGVASLLLAIALVTIQFTHGEILVGALLLAFTAFRSFTGVVQTFYSDLTQIEDQSRYAKRWFEVFETKPKMINTVDALKPGWTTSPTVEFKDVSFAYPETDKIILKHISFTLTPGEKLAIVGLNGAGKTTLIKLLCRVYDPTEGVILINGIDLKEIDLDSWREYLGVLFQDFSNFQMTAKEAIAIARPNEPIDESKVKWAAEMAGAAEFIEELPKKYDHLLWKGFHDGVELSKGQFQRMAVARILYRDALISVLDEPTSAIDAVAEEKIFEVLETKMEGKTVVLISHRFSTVKNADKIAVIEHGVLQEIGNHKELMAKKGRYEELYSMQASRYLETTE